MKEQQSLCTFSQRLHKENCPRPWLQQLPWNGAETRAHRGSFSGSASPPYLTLLGTGRAADVTDALCLTSKVPDFSFSRYSLSLQSFQAPEITKVS